MRTVFNEIENRHELTDELTDEMRYIVVVAQGTSYPTGTGRPQVLSLIIHQTDFKSEEMGTGTASRHSPTGRISLCVELEFQAIPTAPHPERSEGSFQIQRQGSASSRR